MDKPAMIIDIMQKEANDYIERSFRNALLANRDSLFQEYYLGKADAFEFAGRWLQLAIRDAKGEV